MKPTHAGERIAGSDEVRGSVRADGVDVETSLIRLHGGARRLNLPLKVLFESASSAI
ncbi:hypothetical protein [Paenibacillus sedimenti]|uniref:Uncharacterized protein n=1 Tax=Paenibacillus sedimenti TaxID=2770274 RepID=A0A926QJ01_9BACL|nr:hypothetical protein [Paenibacillus sedimenti]MBD0381206.1 hypothetical protein [Paenibacillus sedimenti]